MIELSLSPDKGNLDGRVKCTTRSMPRDGMRRYSWPVCTSALSVLRKARHSADNLTRFLSFDFDDLLAILCHNETRVA